MLIEFGQYKVPIKYRLQEAWRDVWPALPFLVIVLGASILVTYTNGWAGEGTWAMWALTGVVVLLCAWVIIYSWAIRGHVRYHTHGMTVLFTNDELYVPPDVWVDFVRKHVWEPFEPHLRWDGPSVYNLTNGVLIIAESEVNARVREEDGEIRVKQVLGATYPWRRYSRVAAHRLLDPGVAGYELKLQACQVLFPGRSESEDILWMKNHDIL